MPHMIGSLTHHPSSQGWAPGVQTFYLILFFYLFFCTSVLLSPICTWMEGRDGGEEGCYLLDGGMGGRRVATYWMEGCYLLDGGMGGRRVANYFFAFFSIIYILGLVCYKHTIHVVLLL